MCKGVLSLSFVHEKGKEICEITCILVSNTKQHDYANPSILLARTSIDDRNVRVKAQRVTTLKRWGSKLQH